MSISRQPNGLILVQPAYTERVLASSSMLERKPADTPLNPCSTLYRGRVLVSDKIRQEIAAVTYGSILGSLIFVSTRTSLDIATAVSLLGKF